MLLIVQPIKKKLHNLLSVGRDQTDANNFRNKDVLEGGGEKRAYFHWFSP